MTRLIAPLAVGTTAVTVVVAGAVFFWQRNRRKPSRWTAAKDSASAWSKAAAQGAGKAAERSFVNQIRLRAVAEERRCLF
jgi:hypothetical protein